MFLCETLVHANKIAEIRIKLGFDVAFAVDRIGRSGGLALLWRNRVNCRIINYSQNFINVEVCSEKWCTCRFTGFYGFPEQDRRRDSWNLPRSLAQDITLPWCIMGDFNDMLFAEDKRGGSEQPQWLIRGFREAVQDSYLIDLPMEGYPYTWTKGRRAPNPTEERLDRAFATQNWLDEFPHYKFINAISDSSDHSHILLHLVHVQKEIKARIFKFENAWLEEPNLTEVVKEGWNREPHNSLLAKIHTCTEDLEVWGRRSDQDLKKLLLNFVKRWNKTVITAVNYVFKNIK
ncbi:endonuclease/exonuclease/phosphatase family protein [Trifolium medium]|uniref:Endonuclease/exonuclease/phosphatase family protein n=1 Tax=Trifolium medium TaxID=97028 RepID=A0A392M8R0_9FABA|nr:endonuclease/exonuclease/phosphatase family protein [Trifolium medium]